MKTLEDFLFEKRRNPEQNPKITAFDALSKYRGRKDVFVSFTDINKIGINPTNKFKTPIGIYTYPIKAVFDKSIILDFAGDRKYIQVVKPKGKFLKDVSKYSKSDFDADVKKLRQIYKNVDTIEDSIITGIQLAKDPSWGGKMWNITRWISTEDKNPDKHTTHASTVRWNGIWRKLGYSGVGDMSNRGIIHPNEPMQAVFFSKKGFEHIETIMNN